MSRMSAASAPNSGRPSPQQDGSAADGDLVDQIVPKKFLDDFSTVDVDAASLARAEH